VLNLLNLANRHLIPSIRPEGRGECSLKKGSKVGRRDSLLPNKMERVRGAPSPRSQGENKSCSDRGGKVLKRERKETRS